MKIKRNYLIKIAPAVLLVVGAYWLLGSDFFTFLIWWEMICLLGLVFMPVTSRIFRGFDDNGWMFSKVLAVAVCGYVQWLLACLKITPFTGMTCVIITENPEQNEPDHLQREHNNDQPRANNQRCRQNMTQHMADFFPSIISHRYPPFQIL